MAAILQGTDSIYETDNFLPLIELGERAERPPLRPGRGHRPRAAHPRRPLARHVVPDRRRRRALQRGPRLRPAPHHAPGDPAGPPDRDRAGLPAALRRRRARADGRRLPRAGRARRHRSTCGSRARRRRSARRSSRARASSRSTSRARRPPAPRASARPRPSSSTTPTASRSTSRSSSPPSRGSGSTRRASRT